MLYVRYPPWLETKMEQYSLTVRFSVIRSQDHQNFHYAYRYIRHIVDSMNLVGWTSRTQRNILSLNGFVRPPVESTDVRHAHAL